jgi:hypothetical protein
LILSAWWTAWRDLIRKLVALVASFASIVGLLVAFLPSMRRLPWWAITLLIVSAFAFIVLVGLEFADSRGRHVYAKIDAQGIRKYMHRWITHGGRVAIWTRDMSWAQNPETRRLLREKALRNELILCLPAVSPLAAELAEAGAEVCAYGAPHCSKPLRHASQSSFSVATGRGWRSAALKAILT